MAVADKAKRDALLQKCLKNGWSVVALRQQVQNLSGGKRSSGGLQPSPPRNPSPGVALRDINVVARRWMAFDEVWFSGTKPALNGIPKKDQHETMLDELQKAIASLDAVAKAARRGRAHLRDLAKEVRSKVAAERRRRANNP